jgi:hypothetical protein
MKYTVQLDISFEQVKELVRGLSNKEKVLLGRELEKELNDIKLASLLATFKTDDLDMDTITSETEAVRQELYEKRKD